MKNSGKATKAAWRIVFWTLVLLLALLSAGVVARFLGEVIAAVSTGLVGVWLLFVAFAFYFFRDPDPLAPTIPNAIVAPAHGKVDVIDETTEPEVMGGPCRRISIFLSVIDVHVQNAPVSGKVAFVKHKPGKFLSATKAHSAEHNENVLLSLESSEYPGRKVGVRLIAGLIARRICVWVSSGDEVARSERMSLIQFGSRCDLYLPLSVKLLVKLGDKVKGGETIVASFE
jgi:phosphatidylserine decarboxylase